MSGNKRKASTVEPVDWRQAIKESRKAEVRAAWKATEELAEEVGKQESKFQEAMGAANAAHFEYERRLDAAGGEATDLKMVLERYGDALGEAAKVAMRKGERGAAMPPGVTEEGVTSVYAMYAMTVGEDEEEAYDEVGKPNWDADAWDGWKMVQKMAGRYHGQVQAIVDEEDGNETERSDDDGYDIR